MRNVTGFAFILVLALGTSHFFGAVGMTRFVGLVFFAAGVYGTFASSFSISVGKTEVARLTGWYRLFATLPISALGLAVAIYAQEITCLSTKYKHLCA